MSHYHFSIKLGTHLSSDELSAASELLSKSYSRWQQHPDNRNPVATDTSPGVYRRVMRKPNHEVILYYEQSRLCAAFVHALSPQYDRYPLRKLSYLGVAPREKGYEALRRIFTRYAEFVRHQGEDVVITSDLDQHTLNSLLEASGFREVIERNETFFLLSYMMQRRIFSFQKVMGDFAIDQIITLDGKAVRRSKKLFKLQTTPYDFYNLYCRQQRKRVLRSVPSENLELMGSSLAHAFEGICFISSFEGPIVPDDTSAQNKGIYAAVFGDTFESLCDEAVDRTNRFVYLLPDSESMLMDIAASTPLRPGFYDFLFFSLKILGSFYITSCFPACFIRHCLERTLAPSIPLRFIDLVERIVSPAMQLLAGRTKLLSDSSLRTAFHIDGPYSDFSDSGVTTKKDRMIDDIVSSKGDTPTPVIYLSGGPSDIPALTRLECLSRELRLPVLVLDFSQQSIPLHDIIFQHNNACSNPYFSSIAIRDFYQIPVMLESMGLSINTSNDFL